MQIILMDPYPAHSRNAMFIQECHPLLLTPAVIDDHLRRTGTDPHWVSGRGIWHGTSPWFHYTSLDRELYLYS